MFVGANAWLWQAGTSGELDHKRLVDWMKSPHPKYLIRHYRAWGVADVFASITRAPHTRTDLYLRLAEVVDKRHAIAHGDASVDATSSDIRAYVAAARTFGARVDRLLAAQISLFASVPRPW